MNINNNEKADDVLRAIDKIMSSKTLGDTTESGVDLLAIVKKVSRNRRKGESLE